jgi:hypothetical protein
MMPILIAGASRTGTSLVAELVSRWGAFGGRPQDLITGNEFHPRGHHFNPRGYFEHRELDRFLGEATAEVGLQFWQEGFDEAVLAKAREPGYLARARELVAGMEREGRPWYWKNPFLGPFLPFWEEICGGAVHLIPFRHPYAAAVSWQRFFLPEELDRQISIVASNLQRWQHMLLVVLRNTAASRAKLFISYERLLRSPREECRRLAAFLDAQYGLSAGGAERVERMAEIVDPGLERQRAEALPADAPAVSDAQRRLYELLLAKLDDPDAAFDPADYPLAPGWREYLDNVWFLRRFYRQTTAVMNSWTVRSYLAFARLYFRLLRGVAGLGRKLALRT